MRDGETVAWGDMQLHVWYEEENGVIDNVDGVRLLY